MIKYQSFIITLSSLVILAINTSTQALPPQLNHAYGGIMLGYTSINNQQDNASGNTRFSGRGTRTNIYLGLGHAFANRLFIGGEYFVDLGDSGKGFTQTIQTNEVNQSFMYRAQTGVKFRLGYVFSKDCLIYGLSGLNFGRFRDQLTINTTETEVSVWRPGLIYGVGLEYQVKQHLALRFEINQTHFKSFTTDNGDMSVTEKPSATQANFGFNILYYL